MSGPRTTGRIVRERQQTFVAVQRRLWVGKEA